MNRRTFLRTALAGAPLAGVAAIVAAEVPPSTPRLSPARKIEIYDDGTWVRLDEEIRRIAIETINRDMRPGGVLRRHGDPV